MDISFDEKLGHKMGKDLGYGADSKSNRPLDSCTNTPKAKCFNSDMVKALSLSPCNFGSTIDNIDMDLPPSVSLKFTFCLVASVKERLCFELTKFFTLDIGLLAVLRSTLCDKLKGVRKLFYKIDGFGGVLTPSKFLGIIRASFMSESSLVLAKQLAVSKNIVEIVIKEILVNLPKSAVESALVKYGKIFSIKIQLIGLCSQVADLVVFKWSILLGKDSAHVVKANTDKQIWNLKDSYHALLYILLMGTTAHDLLGLVQLYNRKTCYISRNLVSYTRAYCAVIWFDSEDTRKAAICSTLVFKSVNLIWTGLSSLKYAACDNFGYVFFECGSDEKNFGQSFKKRFFCSNSDKKHLVLIYAKKQAPVSYLISFGGVTWASIVSSFPKILSSILFIETNLGMGLVADISHKLNRLLAVSLVSVPVFPTPEHNLMLDMAVDTPLFIPFMPGVITAISQDISPSGSQVLTAKVGGLKANLMVLKNSVKAILNNLDSFGSDSGVITLFSPMNSLT
ncbi:hypothetical protein G9A89_019924 [Geosiphon pyriformis]|nr:hypothetical protein G9A89_019924 [Geosiphon pyriformis]